MRPGAFKSGVSGSSFGADLTAFAKKTGRTGDQAFRGIVIELFSSVIGDTPVDTGRARGNWQTTVGQPANGEVNRTDRTGAAGSLGAKSSGGAVAEVQGAKMKLGGPDVWLSNNLPYIIPLEYGSSKQNNGLGMVRRNMTRIRGIVERATADAKRGK